MDWLIRALTESRALYLSREASRLLSDREAGCILSQYKRVISVTFVRSPAACLVAMMGHLEEVSRKCVARRQVAMGEGEGLRQEVVAHYCAHIRGRGKW